jgi:hypothetical protein
VLYRPEIKNPPVISRGIFDEAMSQSDRFGRQQTVSPDNPANAAHHLTNPVLVLDQGEITYKRCSLAQYTVNQTYEVQFD